MFVRVIEIEIKFIFRRYGGFWKFFFYEGYFVVFSCDEIYYVENKYE